MCQKAVSGARCVKKNAFNSVRRQCVPLTLQCVRKLPTIDSVRKLAIGMVSEDCPLAAHQKTLKVYVLCFC